MKTCLLFALAALCVSIFAEPLSPEDAAAKLKEREAARAASTQPGRSDTDDLRRSVQVLQKQLAAANAENVALKHEIFELKKLMTSRKASDKAQETPGIENRDKKLTAGMTLEEATELLGKPEKIEPHGSSGMKTVLWRHYIWVGNAGGFSAAGTSSRRAIAREVSAEVDSKGVILDVTDSAGK